MIFILVSDTDFLGISAVVFEEDDPSKVNESELLVDYIERYFSSFPSSSTMLSTNAYCMYRSFLYVLCLPAGSLTYLRGVSMKQLLSMLPNPLMEF